MDTYSTMMERRSRAWPAGSAMMVLRTEFLDLGSMFCRIAMKPWVHVSIRIGLFLEQDMIAYSSNTLYHPSALDVYCRFAREYPHLDVSSIC
jgi:hypothetical protein